MNEVHCPNCGSKQIHSGKRGYKGSYGVIGFIVCAFLGYLFIGPLGIFFGGAIGLLAGTLDSNNVILTCLNCGRVFEPGVTPLVLKKRKRNNLIIVLVFLLMIALMIITVYF